MSLTAPRPHLDRRGALALMAGGAAAACTPRRDGETVLRFWAMGNEGGTVGQLMPEFERRNPGVRVSVQPLPWTAAHEKLLTAYAGASLPDVSQIGNTWVAELTAIGALSPTPPAAAELERGPRGGFGVDRHCLTSDPAISAVGEAAAVEGRA